MIYIMLVDARGVTNVAHEMRQNTDTRFTRMSMTRIFECYF